MLCHTHVPKLLITNSRLHKCMFFTEHLKYVTGNKKRKEKNKAQKLPEEGCEKDWIILKFMKVASRGDIGIWGSVYLDTKLSCLLHVVKVASTKLFREKCLRNSNKIDQITENYGKYQNKLNLDSYLWLRCTWTENNYRMMLHKISNMQFYLGLFWFPLREIMEK